MKKIVLFWGVAVLSLCFVASAANAYAGKVFIAHTAVTATNLGGINDLIVSVFSNSVNQSGVGGVAPSSYTLDKNGSYQGTADYIAIDVLSCSNSSIYCLLKGNSRYAVVSGSLGDPVGPDQVISSITSYKQGKPDAPIVADDGIKKGFESGKINWTLSNDFQYNNVFFKLATDAALTAIIKDSSQNDTTSVSGGQYAFGQYVDGRTLTPDTTYYIGLWGTVAGVEEASEYSKNSQGNILNFKTLAGGAITEVPETYTLKKTTTTGINTISIPFILNDATKLVKDKDNKPIGNQANGTVTVQQLIEAINAQINPAKVTVFGWWTANNQKHVGLTSVKDPIAQSLYTGADAVGDVNADGTTDINDILSSPIVTNQPYQVSVDINDKSFALKGYKQ